jgi:hypothetical protein
MRTKTKLACAVLLGLLTLVVSACGLGLGEMADLFATFTPTSNTEQSLPPSPGLTDLPPPTSTSLPPPDLLTPTQICPDPEHCIPPTIVATALAQATWRYIIVEYHLIKCVAVDVDGIPMPCRVRQEPSLRNYREGEPLYRLVPSGTTFDSTSVYHCEVFTDCDPDVVEWYRLATGEWAARLDEVWQDITPKEE